MYDGLRLTRNAPFLQVYDSVRHPAFDYGGSSSKRRLLYSEPTNRGFFTALTRQMQFSGRKSCVRTAFELAKLVYGLDPENDPMGILLTIDFYGFQVGVCTLNFDARWFNVVSSFVRLTRRHPQAGRYQYVQRLGSATDSPFHIKPPNMLFSSALALFYSDGGRLEANAALRNALLTCVVDFV